MVAYAFAEFHDGSFGFWAAGKAGWFEIKEPVAACQLSYNMMKEAASMFYLLADKLRNSRFLHERLSYKQMDNYAMKTFRKVCHSSAEIVLPVLGCALTEVLHVVS